MGRIERQKRQLIEESNKRNLVRLNENYVDYESKVDAATDDLATLMVDIEDLRGVLEDEIMDDEENSENLDLNSAIDSLYDAERALEGAMSELGNASRSIEDFLSDEDKEDEDESNKEGDW